MKNNNGYAFHQELQIPTSQRMIGITPNLNQSEREYDNKYINNVERFELNQTKPITMLNNTVFDTKRLKFTPDEDDILKREIALHGPKKWDKIALSLPGRNGRQCRDRFQNYLNPLLTNGPWSKDEDKLLSLKVKEFGPHWNKISKYFDGRSSNNVKNRWYTHLGKKRHRKNRSILSKSKENDGKESQNYVKEDNICKNNCSDVIENNSDKNFHQNNSLINSSNGFMNTSLLFDNNDIPKEGSKKVIQDITDHKSKNIPKIFFPPIYPPNESLIFPHNQGLFDFLNQEII